MNKYIKTINEFINENLNIKNMILNANDWSDFIEAIRLQYGDIVPLYHATTKENSESIDKNGLQLVHGKNYISYSNEPFLYFQLGRSTYVSEERNVLYRLDVPIEFLEKYAYIDMDSVNKVDVDPNLDSDTKDAIQSFISNDYKLDGIELIIRGYDKPLNFNLTKINK